MNEQSLVWQTTTAVVQAVCSVTLLAWYVLAAHLARRQVRRERQEGFASLVRLCRDLGDGAIARTSAHLEGARHAMDGDASEHFVAWKADMKVIYVCLDVVPHYEVRNPAFSQALTRLWCEVDLKDVEPASFNDIPRLILFLNAKLERVCVEVDAMNALLDPPPRQGRGRAGPLSTFPTLTSV
jgi:hypothetical protein